MKYTRKLKKKKKRRIVPPQQLTLWPSLTTTPAPLISGIGSAIPARGADITFSPGKGEKGMRDGKIGFNDGDGDEILSINSDKTITILGETFDLQEVKSWLAKTFKSGGCQCSLKQIMSQGCGCGGN